MSREDEDAVEEEFAELQRVALTQQNGPLVVKPSDIRVCYHVIHDIYILITFFFFKKKKKKRKEKRKRKRENERGRKGFITTCYIVTDIYSYHRSPTLQLEVKNPRMKIREYPSGKLSRHEILNRHSNCHSKECVLYLMHKLGCFL